MQRGSEHLVCEAFSELVGSLNAQMVSIREATIINPRPSVKQWHAKLDRDPANVILDFFVGSAVTVAKRAAFWGNDQHYGNFFPTGVDQQIVKCASGSSVQIVILKCWITLGHRPRGPCRLLDRLPTKVF
jgi:hypothetical protein